MTDDDWLRRDAQYRRAPDVFNRADQPFGGHLNQETAFRLEPAGPQRVVRNYLYGGVIGYSRAPTPVGS
jgi:hypothetical protein